MLNFAALKRFLNKKKNHQVWGTIIFVTPCAIVFLVMKYYQIDTLDALAAGIFASIVIDPIILSLTIDYELEKELKIIGECHEKFNT